MHSNVKIQNVSTPKNSTKKNSVPNQTPQNLSTPKTVNLNKTTPKSKSKKKDFPISSSSISGFKVTLRAVLEISSELHKNYGYEYLLTSRLTQDNLEVIL